MSTRVVFKCLEMFRSIAGYSRKMISKNVMYLNTFKYTEYVHVHNCKHVQTWIFDVYEYVDVWSNIDAHIEACVSASAIVF